MTLITFTKAERPMPRWWARAACAGAPLADFFTTTTTRRVRELCAGCPVAGECLDEALSWPTAEDFGFRAGTSAHQRAAMRRQTRRADEAAALADEVAS